MRPRIPDPFPWPDDDICIQFGRASYYAHKLEREFKLFLLATHMLNRIPISFDTSKHASLELFLYDQTLGGLIYILKDGGGLKDKKLKKELYRALEARNELAHRALENHDPMHYDMPHRDALIGRICELRFRIGVPFIVIRELRKVAEEEIGITEEELQFRLRVTNTNEKEV